MAADGDDAAALYALRQYISALGGRVVSIGDGWRVERRTRASGASAGHVDAYYVSPDGLRFRSKAEVARLLGHAPKQRSNAGTAPEVATPPTTKGKRKGKHSPYFKPEAAVQGRSGARARAPIAWMPPASPHGLLQEALYEDPWRVLVACVLLNKTRGEVVRRVVFDLFTLCPTAQKCVSTPLEDIMRIIEPLGLHKRAEYIKRLSQQYIDDMWTHVGELCGCGKYACDAYSLFISGEWRLVEPQDKELVKYKQFLLETGGMGLGLTRETLPEACAIP